MTTQKITEPKNNSKQKETNTTSTTAKITLGPSVNAAAVITEYGSPFGEQDISALIDSLNDSIDRVLTGNMRGCEAMLVSQAHALQSIFMNLSRRAIKQEYLKNYETYLKLALKAQSQCRATLETLATIKNPPIVFAQQANIAQGHQQINNGKISQDSTSTSHAGKNEPNRNELLEKKNEQNLEHRTTATTSKSHPELETVETVNWPKN